MINVLTRIKYVPLAYNHASLHMCNPHDINVINVTQHVAHVRHKIASTIFLHCIQKVHNRTTFLHCIQKVRNRTNFLHCIQKVHKPHTISLQASNTVSIYTRVSSFKLRGRMLLDVSNRRPISYTSIYDNHHSSDDNETTTRFTASFPTICRNI